VKQIRVIFLAVFSAGWLLPLYFVAANFAAYLKTELEPAVFGKPVTHSFPILLICKFWSAVTALWLACVIAFWVVRVVEYRPKDGANERR